MASWGLRRVTRASSRRSTWGLAKEPLTFADPADYDAINLLDDISLPNVLEEVKNGEQVTVVCGGRTFKADCEVSDRQRGALLAGGTLNYAKQNAQ